MAPPGAVAPADAVVVGAGPAGLAAAAALQRRRFAVTVVERADQVGARWRSRYEELRLNSWRAMSNLQGLRMPRRWGRYPGRDDFVRYLEAYVRHHGLRVRLETAVERVERGDHGWRLQTSAGPIDAPFAVIATGWDAIPVVPDWPGRGSFTAELIHSSAFRSARPYCDREVLVVGAGNSGIDIAGHLVAAGARVVVSMRTAPNLARRDLLGLPGQPFLVWLSDHLPTPLADRGFALVQRLVFGDLSRYGLPRPPEGPYARFRRVGGNPAIDDGFVAALRARQLRLVADVARLEAGTVVLVDGTRLSPTAVICATGYRRGLEGLVGHLGVLRADGTPLCPGGAPEHPAAPGLYFAGMWGQFSGQIRLGPIHARRIARAAACDRARRGPN